jgi:peptidoglycan/xylan/chitin deacetylase (PgdA/CDA1 family)
MYNYDNFHGFMIMVKLWTILYIKFPRLPSMYGMALHNKPTKWANIKFTNNTEVKYWTYLRKILNIFKKYLVSTTTYLTGVWHVWI